VPDDRQSIIETLRARILRGLHAGTLESGDRLPSARDLVAEFGVDHRLVLSAYHELANEGLVEVRERGGVYAAGDGVLAANLPAVPAKWFAQVFAEGFAREIPGPALAEWLQRSIETLRLRAVVVSTTDDQVAGLARELRDDFGLIAEGITGADIAADEMVPAAIRRADVLITTSGSREAIEALGRQLGKPVIAIDVRPDLVAGEWAILLRQPVWAVVASRQFGEMLKRFFANVRGIENLTLLVFGEDDLDVIPEGAPTYVTHRVRESLGMTKLRGRILPAARTISVDSARAIFDFIVRANVRALRVIHTPPTSSEG
jgi:hypothetical protein